MRDKPLLKTPFGKHGLKPNLLSHTSCMRSLTPLKKKYILVISDQPVICNVLRRLLKIDGDFVLTASGCDEGLLAAARFPINLIVLDTDLNNPSVDVVRTILKHETVTAHLPVVLLSAQRPVGDISKTAAGMDRLLSMPFSLTEVRDAVDRLLRPPSEQQLPG
jgi:two-component system cell cycle response regulator DivK